MRRRIAVTGLILTALLLTGCTVSGTDTSGEGAGPAPGAVAGFEPGTDTGSEPTKADTTEAMVITAELVLTVDEPSSTADEIIDMVREVGGSLALREESRDPEGTGAGSRVVLRIPAGEFDAVLPQIIELGEQDSLSVQRVDVGDQLVDLDARITALQTSVDRLLELMSRAGTTESLLAIEQALSDRQASLDSLTAQRQMLGDQVSYATLSISLFPPGIVADPAPDNFWEGLLTGLSALIAAGSAVLVGLGVLLPWLVVVAILAGLVFVIIRRIRRAPKGSDAA